MSDEIIKLNKIFYDKRARGIWCKLSYTGHKKGCPNISKCFVNRIDIKDYPECIKWYAILEKFDLKKHADKMKNKHPNWTERQCRNLLYWQGGVRKRLRKKSMNFASNNPNKVVLLDIPEACGVHVFNTMEYHGIKLERHKPKNIIKIMLVGIKEASQ